MDPHDDYVAALARYRLMARRIEAGELRTRELLAHSEQRVRLSRELLATPVPKVWPKRHGNMQPAKNPD